MRLPLAVLVAPPLILAGAVAVFAGLHAWQGTPRTSRTSLPEIVEVETVEPRFGLQISGGSPNGVSEAGANVDEAASMARELSLTLSGLPEEIEVDLTASLIDPQHRTVVSSTPIQGGSAQARFADTPARELYLVIHSSEDSPRYQYRDRIVWPASEAKLTAERTLTRVRVEIVGGTPDRPLLFGARRPDDTEWDLPLHRAGLTSSGTEQKPVVVELPLLGPGAYQLRLDGRDNGVLELPGTATIRLTQQD